MTWPVLRRIKFNIRTSCRLTSGKTREMTLYKSALVLSEESLSVDSPAIRQIQTSAGHHARRKLERVGDESDFAITRPSLDRVVRGFARDHHVVDMTLAQTSGADADEASALLEFGDGLASAVAHAGFETADHLVNDQRNGAAIGHAALDALGHEFAET